MEYVLIGICVIAIIAVGVAPYLKNKYKEKISKRQLNLVKNGPSQSELLKTNSPNELIIQMEILPADTIEDESRLVEITNSKVLARLKTLLQD